MKGWHLSTLWTMVSKNIRLPVPRERWCWPVCCCRRRTPSCRPRTYWRASPPPPSRTRPPSTHRMPRWGSCSRFPSPPPSPAGRATPIQYNIVQAYEMDDGVTKTILLSTILRSRVISDSESDRNQIANQRHRNFAHFIKQNARWKWHRCSSRQQCTIGIDHRGNRGLPITSME